MFVNKNVFSKTGNAYMLDDFIVPVVLCGGSGTRLWPLSRPSYPKQFLSLIQEKDNTFLQETVTRLSGLKNLLAPLIICNQEHRFIVAEQMRAKEIIPRSIILEPHGRNTAPAVIISALKTIEQGEDPHLLVLSSDHLIKNEDTFRKVVQNGISFSRNGQLVTFGIPPISPETGYGYIEAHRVFDEKNDLGLKINKFIEKPDLKRAKKFLQDKRYLWNSGIFLFKASTILREIKKYAPEVLSSCEKSLKKGYKDLEFMRLDKDSFSECPDISIDVAVMEKTNQGIVMPMQVGWNDLGNWDSLWKESKKDKEGNTISGKVYLNKVSNTFVKGENRLIVCSGIDNLIIIETNDAVLVMKKEFSQDLKEIVKKLNEDNIPEANMHKKVFRPWGSYLSIADDKGWQVKKINVNPGASLSLQKHKFRTEHWIVVSGIALVELEGEKKILKENQSTYIPLGFKHRLSNPGKQPLVLIEVQSGSYLGEDDIIRYDDNYGRRNS